MTKADIVEIVHGRTGFSKKESSEAVEMILEILKEGIINQVELLDEKTPEIAEDYLRKMMSGLLSGMNVTLNPLSKERIYYYIRRDFIGYGPIQTMMIEYQVEDIS